MAEASQFRDDVAKGCEANGSARGHTEQSSGRYTIAQQEAAVRGWLNRY